jgi:hypothetical protein
MIAIPNDNGKTPDRLDLEHSKADMQMVRSLARKGLLSERGMWRMKRRLENTARNSGEERLRVAADKTLAALQVALMRILTDSTRGAGGKVLEIENQQINIYLPANGREEHPVLTNGHNGNGKH